MLKMHFMLLILLGGSVLNATAQDFTPSYTWSGEIRVRGEVDGRDFDNSTPPNAYTLFRTRLGCNALPFENIRVLIQAQDSRVSGQERDGTGAFSTLADTRNLDLHQGYLEVKKLFADELTLRLGRQELSYGNERMLGAVGWHNVGRSFDGGLLRFDIPSVTLDLLAMNVGEVQSYTPIATPAAVQYFQDFGQELYAMYGGIKSIEGHTVDGYALYHVNRHQTIAGEADLQRLTIGSYANGSFNSCDYETEIAYQTGKRGGIDIAAYMATLSIGQAFTDVLITRASLGFELLSGTPTGDTKYKAFDPTFHTGHKFYGFMDYFINIPTNTGDRGLMDAIARASLKPATNVAMNIWFHHFGLAQASNGEKTLGEEVDLVTSYRYNKALMFEIGVSACIPGPVMRQRYGADDAAFWGYLTTTVSF